MTYTELDKGRQFTWRDADQYLDDDGTYKPGPNCVKQKSSAGILFPVSGEVQSDAGMGKRAVVPVD